MDSSHSKEGFFEGQVKKKGAWSFWGKQRKDEIWNIKTRYNVSIINMYMVSKKTFSCNLRVTQS